MFKWVCLGVSILAACAALVCLRQGLASFPDLVEVARPTIDFGKVRQGSVIEAQFEIRNRYGSSVQVKDVSVSCSCTEPTLSQTKLQPGDTAKIGTKWRIGSARGRVTHSLILRYVVEGRQEMPNPQPVVLGLRAEVIPDFVYSPNQLTFFEGKPGKQTVVFGPGTLSSVSILRAYCTQRAFTAVVPPGGDLKVDVSFDPAGWPGDSDIQPYLAVQVTSPNEPVCTVPLVVVPRVHDVHE